MTRFMLAIGLFCSSFIASSAWSAPASAPQVVVSIKPIHSLVAGVMQGVAEPQLLIKGGGSPHGYVLRPSEARALANAQLIVWVGPQLEGFLLKPLATLGSAARKLELTRVLQAQLLPIRDEAGWEAHAHQDAEEHGGHREAHEFNPHLWLSPRLAQQIVAETAGALAAIDPAHQRQYRENAELLHLRLEELHLQLQARLAPVRMIPYVVFHDAYQYFEASYRLNAVGSIAIDPERLPGARGIREMRAKIERLQARCVFSEPQFEPRLVATIIEGTGARSGILDPLGADLAAGAESYFLLLNALADNLLEGLRGD